MRSNSIATKITLVKHHKILMSAKTLRNEAVESTGIRNKGV